MTERRDVVWSMAAHEVAEERAAGFGDPELCRILVEMPLGENLETWAYWNLLAADRAEELGLMHLAAYHRGWFEWWKYQSRMEEEKEPPA